MQAMLRGATMKLRTTFLMVGALALLLVGMAVVAPDFDGATVSAQAPTPTVSVPATTTTPTAAPVKQDNSGKWGLLGLLGLLGLAGLLKRPHTEVRTVETQRVDPVRDRTR
jgi:MYXO-CTERM domain-containing protein